MILTGANTYSGGTTIAAGTLQLGDGGTTGSIVGNVVDNGTLAFDRSDAVTFPGAISGTGSVSQIGPGSTTLTAANSYSGGTLLAAGTLIAGNNSALGSGALTVAANAVGPTTLDNTAGGDQPRQRDRLEPVRQSDGGGKQSADARGRDFRRWRVDEEWRVDADPDRRQQLCGRHDDQHRHIAGRQRRGDRQRRDRAGP